MGKKKVAFLLPWLKMGGTNKIALNLIRELSEYCDVTLILSQNSGELLSEIPDGIRVIIDEMDSFRRIVKGDISHLRLGFLCRDVLYYARVRLGRDSDDNYKYIVDRHGFITDEVFDCAISYHGQSPERLLNLLYRIHAKKKAVWIHGEMGFSDERINGLKKYYAQIDHFFFVSNATRDSFYRRIPFDMDRSTVYYNPIDRAEITKKAEEAPEPAFSEQYLNLLTVGRVSAEKGQDMIPAVTKNLLNRGYSVRWYVIGDGDMRPKLEAAVDSYGLRESVFLLGTQLNPYKYMKACDIYVQPSYTEGYSTTICEAGILGKAIIGTKTSGGIREQITDGVDGMIVDAGVSALTEGILRLADDEGLRRQFEQRIIEKNFEGTGEIVKFLQILKE